MIKKCPICGKELKYNYFNRRWECPKIKTNREKRLGCGYINDNKRR
jgi:hypothetical protein